MPVLRCSPSSTISSISPRSRRGKLDIENVTFEMDSVMNNISTMVAQKIQDKETRASVQYFA